MSIADDPGVFGQNLSGLAYQPSGTSAPGVLWAVRNNPSTLFRLIWDGAKWKPDTANGWANGKQLVYPDGGGVPDAEGVTLAGGDANGIFVATERNDDGINSNTSRTSVLRYDVSAPGATLTATQEWDLTRGHARAAGERRPRGHHLGPRRGARRQGLHGRRARPASTTRPTTPTTATACSSSASSTTGRSPPTR